MILRLPLRAINNLSEWIMEDMPEMPADIFSNFELLRGRVMRMENLINGVLDYSRIGKILIESQLTDLKIMLQEIIETIVPAEGYNVLLRIIFLNLKFREYYSNKYSLI
jgi:signal transduction histidine kinase